MIFFIRFFVIACAAAWLAGGACTQAHAEDRASAQPGKFNFPLLQNSDGYMRPLVENCFGYIKPRGPMYDQASCYPFEGWNQEPEKGLFLRSFTQLTAIGSWIELLANIAAGYAENPYLSGSEALGLLERAMKSLAADQRDPGLSDKGLLVNFMGLEGGVRKGPLEETVDLQKFVEKFGDAEGGAIWRALQAQGWIRPEKNGSVGRVIRSGDYGYAHFTGALAPFSGQGRRDAIMAILDARAVLVMFGDNVNLTASVAKACGALMRPVIRENPRAAALRAAMEQFIEAQSEGYRHLYDSTAGTISFGWDAGRKRFVGWDDGAGNWVTGRMDYLINEFRGAWLFSVLRFGLPLESIKNAGFTVKPYRGSGGAQSYGPCAWEGSAFQLFGFNIFMGELGNPGWRAFLERALDIELEFSRSRGLPGFLSESYSGNGVEYTRFIGIADVAVTNHSLITHAPSLYSIGAGYLISPEKVSRFLGESWPRISSLFTDHGPWEGYDSRSMAAIPYQTTTHTLSLVLAAIGSAEENMRRYLDYKGLTGALGDLYRQGREADFIALKTAVGWTADGSPVSFSSDGSACRFQAVFTGPGGIAIPVPQEGGASISGGILSLAYRSESRIRTGRIVLKRRIPAGALETVPVQILLELKNTGGSGDIIEICLPSTPALSGIGEISLVLGDQGQSTSADIALTRFSFKPL